MRPTASAIVLVIGTPTPYSVAGACLASEVDLAFTVAGCRDPSRPGSPSCIVRGHRMTKERLLCLLSWSGSEDEVYLAVEQVSSTSFRLTPNATVGLEELTEALGRGQGKCTLLPILQEDTDTVPSSSPQCNGFDRLRVEPPRAPEAMKLVYQQLCGDKLNIEWDYILSTPTVVTDTPRLVARRIDESCAEDVQLVVDLVNTDGWKSNIADMGIHTAEQAVAYIRNRPLKMYEEEGIGSLMLFIRTSPIVERYGVTGEGFDPRVPGRRIGFSGLIRRAEFAPVADLGFALLPAAMGEGYAFEASLAALFHQRYCLVERHCMAVTRPTNAAAHKLLSKLGFTARPEQPLMWGNPQSILDRHVE